MVQFTKQWFLNSLTILWARVLSFAGLFLEVAYQAADILEMPAIKLQIQTIFPQKYWPVYLIIIGVTTELARRRTLK